MPEVEVRNLKNQVVDRLSLSDDVFAYSASETLVWEAVNALRASQRKGTHATKNRAAVSGSGKKLWRQKGTGRARMGSLRSPLWRKGGTVFGPQPRDYSIAFPKKKRRGAMKVVLTDKLNRRQMVVVDALDLASYRTREFVDVLKGLELDKKVLIIDSRQNKNLYLSSRNLSQVKMVPADGVNVVDLLNYERLLISKNAVLQLQEMLQR
ncbi:MAG: 50S ribosomal protein L4 [Acidobacteria bacterium]|nr:50S ribosomal protein L4 [Acidobacteriota bacterium]